MAKTITKTYEIYPLSELPESAQEKAHSDYLQTGLDYYGADDGIETLNAFAEAMPVKIKDYEFGYRARGIVWEMTCDDAIAELSGQRLATYLWNNYRDALYSKKWYGSFSRPETEDRIYHRKLKYSTLSGGPNKGSHYYQYHGLKIEAGDCPLTGMAYDCSVLNPIIEFIARPDSRDFQDLIGDCLDALEKDIMAEMEHQESFEAFADTSQANDWTYTASGKFERA